jgi:hypothetical protein
VIAGGAKRDKLPVILLGSSFEKEDQEWKNWIKILEQDCITISPEFLFCPGRKNEYPGQSIHYTLSLFHSS